MSRDDLHEGPGVERSAALTDAVVAIAMTILVLPLVELVPEVDDRGLRPVLGDHQDVFLGFGLSFVVIYVFWLAHQQAFAALAGPSAVPRLLNLLNVLWLLLVAFLPFPTALVGRHASTTSVPLYIATMALLSATTSAMTQLGLRSRRRPDARRRAALSWLGTGVFVLCALVGAVAPDLGLFGLLLLVVLRVVGGLGGAGRSRPRSRPGPGRDHPAPEGSDGPAATDAVDVQGTKDQPNDPATNDPATNDPVRRAR